MKPSPEIQNAMLKLHTNLIEMPTAEYEFYTSVYKDQCNQTPLKSWLLCNHRFDPNADYSKIEAPIELEDILAGNRCVEVAKNLRDQKNIKQLEFEF